MSSEFQQILENQIEKLFEKEREITRLKQQLANKSSKSQNHVSTQTEEIELPSKKKRSLVNYIDEDEQNEMELKDAQIWKLKKSLREERAENRVLGEGIEVLRETLGQIEAAFTESQKKVRKVGRTQENFKRARKSQKRTERQLLEVNKKLERCETQKEQTSRHNEALKNQNEKLKTHLKKSMEDLKFYRSVLQKHRLVD